MEIYNIGVNGFNSYLICGEKNIIVDTVPYNYINEFFENLEKHTKASEVDYVVFTRTNPDCTGGLKELLFRKPQILVYATVAGLKNLKEIINADFPENVIKNDAELFGLKFIITPNLSWPDTCVAYLENEKILFSGNLFCDSPECEFFGKEFLKNAVERIKKLEIKEILTGYNKAQKIDMYDEFLNFIPEEKIGVVYASTSGQTKALALTIADEIRENGKECEIFDCDERINFSELENCSAFVFGTPTINHNAKKSVLDVICSLNVVKNTDKKAFVFGSFGWSGEGVNIVSVLLGNLKIRVTKKPYRCILNPSDDNLAELRKCVREFLKEL